MMMIVESFNMQHTVASLLLLSLIIFTLKYFQGGNTLKDGEKQQNDLEPPVIEAVSDNFKWESEKPFPYRPFKKGLYKMNLAIRKLDPNDIICIEDTYLERTELRETLFETEKLYGCHDSAIDALREAYAFVFDHLIKRYPMYFEYSRDKSMITNKIRNVEVPTNTSFMKPEELLKIIATNIEEDVLILIKNPDTDQPDEYILRAGISLFPAGFNPLEKLNQPLTKIHGPVPNYKEKLQTSMNKFFARLKPYEFIVRNNWSIQTHTNICAPTGSHATPDEAKVIHPLYPEDLDFNKCFFRVEKQCFTRLPISGADIMFIRTYTTPLMELRKSLSDEEKETLCSAIDGITDGFSIYKKRIQWGEAAKSFIKGESNGSNPRIERYKFIH
jgi:hypothetical protein